MEQFVHRETRVWRLRDRKRVALPGDREGIEVSHCFRVDSGSRVRHSSGINIESTSWAAFVHHWRAA